MSSQSETDNRGEADLSKRRASTELVCVEPAQVPLEGILAARGLT
jgi:hypothetical protein